MGQQEDLQRRRQGIVALVCFTVVFFVGWIAVNVGQALHHGYGLFHGRVIANEVGDQSGYGWWGDLLVLTLAPVACGLLVGAWQWLGQRLPISSDPRLSPKEVDSAPFYVVDIPKITRTLIVVGCVCAVAAALSGALLFPVILIKYGW